MVSLEKLSWGVIQEVLQIYPQTMLTSNSEFSDRMCSLEMAVFSLQCL